MTEPIRLTFDLSFDVRSSEEGQESDGRTIHGRIVPYGEVITQGGNQEAFAPGVFSEVVPDNVVLLWQHDPTRPVGRMTELREEEDGAYGSFRIAETQAGDEVLTLARERVARGLSVGFVSQQADKKGAVRTHRKARLVETSIVTFPAYPSATVLAVREREEGDPVPESDETTEVVVEAQPDITQFQEETSTALREIRADIAQLTVIQPDPEPEMSLREGLAEVLRMVAENPAENRALADVIGTGTGNAEGLIHPTFATEVLGVLEPLRPFFSAAGTYPFPSVGYGVSFPRITQHTQVAKRTGEKTEVASRELTVAPGLYPMEWFAGGVDVALELISQSEPGVREVVVGDMLDQYAIVTEDEFVTDVEAAATAGGAALDTSSWGALTAALIATSQAIKVATGRPGDRVALTTASWTEVVGLLNPAAPAALPGGGPDFTAESVDLKGITAFHSPESTVDIQFNQKALRKSEKPPLTVTATNVALMGQDIGVLGATIVLPLYPAGIIAYE